MVVLVIDFAVVSHKASRWTIRCTVKYYNTTDGGGVESPAYNLENFQNWYSPHFLLSGENRKCARAVFHCKHTSDHFDGFFLLWNLSVVRFLAQEKTEP